MIQKYFTFLVILISNSFIALSQTAIKGTVYDEKGQPVPFANVVALSGGVQVTGAQSDFDGKYTIKPINPGKYSIKATCVGYQPIQYDGVVIEADKIKIFDIKMTSTTIVTTTVEVVAYKEELISKDKTQSGGTVTKEDIDKMPARDASTVASTIAGVTQIDDGGALYVRGSRSDATEYYIDGVKVRGSSALPKSSIEQVSVITGGVPAQYGDATGGIITITTRGPSRDFSYGTEFITSEFLDPYGYNLLALNATGPILMTKDAENPRSLIGFFIAGEATYQRDPSPSPVGLWKVKDEKLAEIEEEPLVYSATTGGTVKAAEYLRMEDLEEIKTKLNVFNKAYNLSGKIDMQPTKNTYLTVGGNISYNNFHSYVRNFALLDYKNNPQRIRNTWRTYVKFTQKFPNPEGAEGETSLIKNVYYTLQADYSRYHALVQDDSHKDNYFRYGYIGKFVNEDFPIYSWSSDSINGNEVSAYYLQGYIPLLKSFEPSDINPIAANYTEQYLRYFPIYPFPIEDIYDYSDAINLGYTVSADQILMGNGLRNGYNPQNIYSLWYNVGYEYPAFGKYDFSQARFTGFASADIKDHAFLIGFEYEQSSEASWTIYPIGLWTHMDLLANKHISELDKDNPILVYDEYGVFQDTVNYPRKYNEDEQAFFDINMRKKLGLPIDDLTWIDIDSYDPGFFSLDMFSADELLNDGAWNRYVYYYGFDYMGKKLKTKPTLADFFNEKDENGNYTRNIAPFQPIYMAGYITDKFAFQDLIFNIGVRVDRFDANQMVLKDKYLLYEAYTAKEVTSIGGETVTHPATIGPDYVVYVDKIKDPSAIVGYRNGDDWYDKTGAEIADPTVLAEQTATGKISPYLLHPEAEIPDIGAFEDYTPQVTYMPRIAFSFPISEDALFFAHYDILTQRPPDYLYLDPSDYLFIENMVGQYINNPNLKPEKTIDYEFGFQQKLSGTSSIKMSAFYRELRDMIQVTKIICAYPVDYLTFTNIDFGTVKGFSVMYDLRRTGNVRMQTSYTLQFANGTGSTATAGVGLIESGQPNLRTIIPLDYDQRHSIVMSVDYRYGERDNYNGPLINIKGRPRQILRNTGANFIIRAGSGVPYSRQENVTNEAGFGIRQSAKMKGTWNGSRLPWQFNIDAKIDKDITLSFGKGEENKRKDVYLNIYLEIQNLLNTKNVIDVYRYTGNSDDDGYLTAPQTQGEINGQLDPQSYRDLYLIKVNNPAHYSLPRRIRLGVVLNF